MTLLTRNEWKMNALSFAGHPAQKAAAERRLSSFASATAKASSYITIPMTLKLSALPKEILLADKESIFAKSSAQVATLVRPQVVSPKSCELKLGRQRPYRLMGRFSKQERDIVEARAKAANLSVNEYIRATSMGGDYTSPNSAELVRALLDVRRELTAQGNNLNQIARASNSGIASAAEAESMVGMVARSILKTQKEICAALSKGREPEL